MTGRLCDVEWRLLNPDFAVTTDLPLFSVSAGRTPSS
jgi:hypothetical protein